MLIFHHDSEPKAAVVIRYLSDGFIWVVALVDLMTALQRKACESVD